MFLCIGAARAVSQLHQLKKVLCFVCMKERKRSFQVHGNLQPSSFLVKSLDVYLANFAPFNINNGLPTYFRAPENAAAPEGSIQQDIFALARNVACLLSKQSPQDLETQKFFFLFTDPSLFSSSLSFSLIHCVRGLMIPEVKDLPLDLRELEQLLYQCSTAPLFRREPSRPDAAEVLITFTLSVSSSRLRVSVQQKNNKQQVASRLEKIEFDWLSRFLLITEPSSLLRHTLCILREHPSPPSKWLKEMQKTLSVKLDETLATVPFLFACLCCVDVVCLCVCVQCGFLTIRYVLEILRRPFLG